jgi:hypothetical protein
MAQPWLNHGETLLEFALALPLLCVLFASCQNEERGSQLREPLSCVVIGSEDP